jgi:DNA polymerase II small subunit
MEKRDVLKKSVENGFFLDRGMLEFFCGLKEKEFNGIIEKLKGFNINEKILTKEVFDKYKSRIGVFLDSEERKDYVNILNNIGMNSGKIEASDFVSYFRSRFDKMRDFLVKKDDIQNLTSIRRIGRENGNFSLVGMVYDKRITKNKNLLLEVEDLTGRIIILVNRDNKQLFEQAKNIVLDDILCFKCSGSSKMLFASGFVYPDCCLDSERFGQRDEFIVFVSDLHVGSKLFLEDNLMRFIDWLNGKVGDSRQKAMALKVKYLVLAGDNIDGVGVYPGQEKFLNIKGCRSQYRELARILSQIRKDVEIIMCPGTHDAVWVGEPQPAILDKWVLELKGLENLRIVSNPFFVEIAGLKILISHNGNFNELIDKIEEIRVKYGNRCPTKVMNEILKRRHLASVYSDMDIVLGKDDDLVINNIPDVFVLAGQHKAMVGNYNNILNISTSCFQSRTDFDEKVGSFSNPCKVPILNLKSKEVKILDFSGKVENGIKWEVGDNLVCPLDNCK